MVLFLYLRWYAVNLNAATCRQTVNKFYGKIFLEFFLNRF